MLCTIVRVLRLENSTRLEMIQVQCGEVATVVPYCFHSVRNQ